MDMSNAIASRSGPLPPSLLPSPSGREPEDADAWKVLGRVADAFDNPGSLYKADKEVLFVVNVVKSRHLLSSRSSEECVHQDATYGSYDSSFDSSSDEDVEVVELGDASRWEHASSYPYASRQHASPRSFSERIFRKDDGMYDVTKMLLTSSPLDRLDRLARMELKKMGWFERTDKWSVVELGLQVMPLPITPPKTPKNAGVHVGGSGEQFSSTKTSSSNDEKHTSRSPRRPRRGHGPDTSERNREQSDATKSSTPTSTPSPKRSQGTDSDLADLSTLSYADDDASRLSRKNTTTPVRASRHSDTLLHSQTSGQQTGGRLGQVVRNFVKRMLPPSSGSGTSGRKTNSLRTRQTGKAKGSPSGRRRQENMTPRSDVSGESRWTFASAGSWMETSGQGCLDYQATNRWSGFWH
ncbi:hypothetical protein JVT61DRAFT_14489 [Boletus reticuloceps]|uniref:Uncharacterized protein n=1 Tax=Boletus reticuloceps TaxID=495285 RepID=A0A8I3ABU5_9AGAM|nr:hypothetical protein JVT61DRAFT_14489 [Boletus reticuloceps]